MCISRQERACLLEELDCRLWLTAFDGSSSSVRSETKCIKKKLIPLSWCSLDHIKVPVDRIPPTRKRDAGSKAHGNFVRFDSRLVSSVAARDVSPLERCVESDAWRRGYGPQASRSDPPPMVQSVLQIQILLRTGSTRNERIEGCKVGAPVHPSMDLAPPWRVQPPCTCAIISPGDVPAGSFAGAAARSANECIFLYISVRRRRCENGLCMRDGTIQILPVPVSRRRRMRVAHS